MGAKLQAECGLCGRKYTARRKIEHVKTKHMTEASQGFASQYIDETAKICSVCKNEKAFEESVKSHVSRKHKGRAAQEYSKTF